MQSESDSEPLSFDLLGDGPVELSSFNLKS